MEGGCGVGPKGVIENDVSDIIVAKADTASFGVSIVISFLSSNALGLSK
jgi:hypothetical protein